VAVAERAGQWWAVSVPDVPGVFTQARRLQGRSGAGAMARDALALMLDISAEDIEVEVRPRLPEDLARA
jgi:predicted RNase H-like HicB family nuclease